MTDWNTMKCNFNFPTSIRFGKDVIFELAPHLKEQGLKHVLLVSDPGMLKLPVFQSVVDSLTKADLKVSVFSEIAKNPVKSNVLNGVALYQKSGCDCVVGFGGGASMDVARAIVLKVNHPLDLFAYDDAIGGDRFVTNEVPYFVTVPTTSGTGSEVGRSTVIADDVTHEKKILFAPKKFLWIRHFHFNFLRSLRLQPVSMRLLTMWKPISPRASHLFVMESH